jgi:type IV pilus assembly protein PilB
MVDRSKSLRDSLVASGLLNQDQVREAIEEGRRTGETLIKSILRKGMIKELDLINFLEKEMEIPRVDLSSYLVDQKIVGMVPINIAKRFKLIPLFKVGDVITIAMVDPFDVMALDEVRSKSKCDVEPMVATTKGRGPGRALGSGQLSDRDYHQSRGGRRGPGHQAGQSAGGAGDQ